MNDHDWEDLLYNLELQKCILVLGPDLYTAEGDLPLHRQLAGFLQEQADQLRIRVSDNGWFHLLPSGNWTSPVRQINAFYQQPRPQAEAMLHKLVRLRFPVFVSLTPDNKLRQAFEGLPAEFEVYVRNKPHRENLPEPTADRPLVYQLLGSLEDRNSLVLTYDDFYDYLRSVFAGNSMSPVLRAAIMDAEYFLFLGMPFDQWYIHLFMRVLNQTKEKERALKVAVPFDHAHADGCAEQYTIKFVNDHIDSFVDELIGRCEGSPAAARLLRPLQAPQEQQARLQDTAGAFLAELTGLAEADRFDELYERVKKLLMGAGDSGKDLLVRAIQTKGRLSKLQEEQALGIIDRNDYTLEMNRVRKAFLDLCNELGRILPTLMH